MLTHDAILQELSCVDEHYMTNQHTLVLILS